MKDIVQILFGGLLVLLLAFGFSHCSKNQEGAPKVISRANGDILDLHGGKIVFVHSTTCPSCVEAAEFLKKSGASDNIVSVEVKEGGSQVLAKLDTVFVPVLVLPDKAAVGFNKDQWIKLLKESAGK